MSQPKGNPYPTCRDCRRRHKPERACTPIAGQGDGVYHPAPFLKKYGG